MRSGVPSSPSRAGSSPAQRINVRTASSASSRVGRRTETGCPESGLCRDKDGATAYDIGFSRGLRICARKPRAPTPRSVEPDRLMRAVERKGRDPDPEAVTGSGFHLVAADHNAGRGRQGGAAGVFEAFAGSEHRLLADDAGAPHLLHLPAAVGDLPMPIAQLHRLQAAVLDADMVGPDVTSFGRRGLVLEVERLYADFDRSRDFRIHRRCSSLSGSARSPAAPIRRSTRTMSAGYRKPSRSPRRRQELEGPIGDVFAGCIRADRLDTDVVGAGIPMLLDAGADGALVAPRHQGIDKPVGTTAGEIGVAEALPAPVVDVVFELHLARKRLASGAARSSSVGFEHHPDLGA